MPIRIEVLPEYVHILWYGKLVDGDLARLGSDIPRIGMQLGRAPHVLHTFGEIEGTGLKPEALRAHGRHLGTIVLPNRCRAASVCAHPLAYGMARMMQLLNENPSLQIEVFSDLEEALRWLKACPS